MRRISGFFCFVLALWMGTGLGHANPGGARTIPSRIVPVPSTVSPTLQNLSAQGPWPSSRIPNTTEEWRAESSSAVSQELLQQLAKMRDKFGVTVAPRVVGGVRCYVVTPHVDKTNRNRLLVGLHSGGFMFESGESGMAEAIVTAGLVGIKVVWVDYRMLPDHPFPAAMDDAMAVWRKVVTLAKPGNIGIFGSSAGGGMVLSLVQRAKKEGLPLPGAILSGSPWSDLSKTGDSYYTNDGVDVNISYDGFWAAVAKLYANGRDLRDPLISPVYGDFSAFPPTFLVSGTRDLFLSNTVRVQRKLLQMGVPTELEIGEGQSHMMYLDAAPMDAPESVELYSQIKLFFNMHLGR